MIEEQMLHLLNYGALGLWTLTLLYQQFASQKRMQEFQKEMLETQKSNTIALTKVHELLEDIEKFILKKKVETG